MSLKEMLEVHEKKIIEDYLVASGGEIRAAARELRVSERKLWNRIKALAINYKAIRVASAKNP